MNTRQPYSLRKHTLKHCWQFLIVGLLLSTSSPHLAAQQVIASQGGIELLRGLAAPGNVGLWLRNRSSEHLVCSLEWGNPNGLIGNSRQVRLSPRETELTATGLIATNRESFSCRPDPLMARQRQSTPSKGSTTSIDQVREDNRTAAALGVDTRKGRESLGVSGTPPNSGSHNSERNLVGDVVPLVAPRISASSGQGTSRNNTNAQRAAAAASIVSALLDQAGQAAQRREEREREEEEFKRQRDEITAREAERKREAQRLFDETVMKTKADILSRTDNPNDIWSQPSKWHGCYIRDGGIRELYGAGEFVVWRRNGSNFLCVGNGIWEHVERIHDDVRLLVSYIPSNSNLIGARVDR